jgi:hypothetical protein
VIGPKYDRAVMCNACGSILYVIQNGPLDLALSSVAIRNHIDFPGVELLAEPIRHEIMTVDFFDNIEMPGIRLDKIFTD